MEQSFRCSTPWDHLSQKQHSSKPMLMHMLTHFLLTRRLPWDVFLAVQTYLLLKSFLRERWCHSLSVCLLILIFWHMLLLSSLSGRTQTSFWAWVSLVFPSLFSALLLSFTSALSHTFCVLYLTLTPRLPCY